MINNERIDMDIAGIDWSRFDVEEVVKGLNREKRD